ncbi:energy-coupling factor transporter transmembrane protein EcfT [Geovibrio thiophilus]|uniref:Energy-coupling factor transporter transmembrane protein EcfT n=1 Tax=Geovibrio thiophilus TaxID=139438 RepID=A0A410JVI7_9BACT|nr:energy-coupling factor transporter transmembrane component T [Geovibrio thiophilus]QAR32183.1 energy-coupling factor transporter transmembrane protein EcfT [Geovibrio thiophilus]
MKFSPAVAIAAAVVYSLLIAFRTEITAYDAVFALFLAAVSFKSAFRPFLRLLRLNLVILFICATVLIFHRDTSYALLIFLRANLILSANLLLFAPHGAMGIYYGFCGLKFPDRFTVLLFFVIKYIEILGAEYKKMRDSLRIRCFNPKTNLFTYKTFGYLVGMLFVKSMEKAKSLHHAMILRGFKGKLYPFNTHSLTASDAALVFVLLIQTALTIGQLI